MLLWNSQLPVSIYINALSPFAFKPCAAFSNNFWQYFKIKAYQHSTSIPLIYYPSHNMFWTIYCEFSSVAVAGHFRSNEKHCNDQCAKYFIEGQTIQTWWYTLNIVKIWKETDRKLHRCVKLQPTPKKKTRVAWISSIWAQTLLLHQTKKLEKFVGHTETNYLIVLTNIMMIYRNAQKKYKVLKIIVKKCGQNIFWKEETTCNFEKKWRKKDFNTQIQKVIKNKQ